MRNIEKLKNAFVNGLGIEPERVVDSLSYQDGPWDSVAHMALVLEIENAFGIMLDTDDVIDMSSFAKAGEIVGKYGIDIET